MKRDTLFLDESLSQTPFKFTENIATVFDDMVSRSVPCYSDIIKLIVTILAQAVPQNGYIYDLGCSTGNTIKALLGTIVGKNITIEGIDLSPPMLAQVQQKLSPAEKNRVILTPYDLNQPISLKDTDAIILNLTLQFLHASARKMLLKECYRALASKGIVMIIEKIGGHTTEEDIQWSTWYSFYKTLNGYSPKEIKNKKKALTGILNPLSVAANEQLFHDAGFTVINQQFRWLNFMGWALQK